LSNFLVCFFFLLAAWFHSEYFSFPHNSSSSSVAIAMGTAALATGTTAVAEAVGAAPGPAVGGTPQTPEGMLEESEEELEMEL
jgi:hypothetical protein